MAIEYVTRPHNVPVFQLIVFKVKMKIAWKEK